MSLINRKPRPLKRDDSSLRDDRLFIIACDDTYAPKQYFNFFRITRVKVHVVPTEDGTSTAERVLGRLLEFEYEEGDERWMLLDTDHCIDGNHKKRFIQSIQAAKAQNINIALSKPCFEIWLLLHHMDKKGIEKISNAKEAEELLRDTLGEYNKRNLKKIHYPMEGVGNAYKVSEELDLLDKGGDIPEGNLSRVYLLWNSIAKKGLPSQLPKKLVDMISKEK